MENNSSVVRISNILNLTRQEFTVIEKHIFHFMLNALKQNQGFNLQDIDNELPLKVIINASDILKNSMNKDALKEAVKKITSRNFFFDFSKPDSDYFGSVNPIPYAKYTSKKGKSSEILIEIHHSCKKLFLELAQGYTNLLLEAILNLKSEYSIRMYELMSMHLNNGDWTVKIEDLRTLLGLNNSKYKDFFQLKKFILEYSQKELLEHCGIYFEWAIAAKQRKKITALTFTITTQKEQEKQQVNADIKATMDYIKTLTPREIAEKSTALMQQYRLTAPQIDYVLSDNAVFNNFVKVHAIIENMIEKGKSPRDRTAYLAKSLGLNKIKFAQK